ncbi:putative ATP-dependent helicase [Moumouvirus australiensis]|uniref:Putative ATP-dependent helicase n=1 Tax=Moumouvirus australiensis TaxID=2109587 RepID=A0A2P1EM88_9VIRU|nr:putative ATP-dependent helicase [Moumouvirus australiensis]AVL95001.1 putative ATP-dependent helicase [Moumouvirus australiensis]
MYRSDKTGEVFFGKMDQMVSNNHLVRNKSTEKVTNTQYPYKKYKPQNYYSQEYKNPKYIKNNRFLNKPNENICLPINFIQSSYFQHDKKFIDNLLQTYNDFRFIFVNNQNIASKHFFSQYSHEDLFNNLSKILNHNKPTFIIIQDFDIENKFCWLNYKFITNFISETLKNNNTMIKLVVMTENIDVLTKLIPEHISKYIQIIKNNNSVIIFDDKSIEYPLNSHQRYQRATEIVKNYMNKKYRGNYLILVPNKEQAQIVNKYFSDSFYNIHIINSNYPLKSIKYTETQIYIATEDISYQILKNLKINIIIDTMLTHKNSDNITWKSKNSCMSYKNILESNGLYICMTSESFYSSLPEYKSLTFDMVDVMKILNMGFKYIDILSHKNINKLLKSMCDYGICDLNNNLTDIGKYCNEFPLEIKNSLLLYHLNNQAESDISIYLCILCTIQLYGTGIFVWPKKSDNEDIVTYSMKIDDIITDLENKYGGYSDIDTIFNVWKDLIGKCNTLNMLDIRKYCDANGLNFGVLKKIIILVRECVKINNIKNYGLKISFDKNQFVIPSNKEFSIIFYSALEKSHKDYQATIYHNYKSGKSDIVLNNKIYRVDNRSIHKMDTSNDSNKIYYVLSFNNYAMSRGDNINIINLLHTVCLENEYTFEEMFEDPQDLSNNSSDEFTELFPD